jgi:hypothetical protein
MGIGFGLPLLGLHLVSMLAFSLGLLFLIFWVWKTFSGPQLKRWGLWLLILGDDLRDAALACLTLGTEAPRATALRYTWEAAADAFERCLISRHVS